MRGVPRKNIEERIEKKRGWAVVVRNTHQQEWLYAVCPCGTMAVYFDRRDAWKCEATCGPRSRRFR